MAKEKAKVPFNARSYMEMAIAEMDKSKEEPRTDNKVSPKVGAVLVFPDGRVGLAHRGQLREGDHAEYTLIERLFTGESLEDCILFTTLEPCASRNSPKVACCRRTTNARIKTVYVGIADPDPTVDGKGIKHLENHGAKVIMFDRDLQAIINKKNKDFIAQALERKHQSDQEEFIEISPLERPVVSTDFSEFSAEALQTFIYKAKLHYKVESQEFQRYLTDLGVLAYDKDSQSLRPSGVGIMLFGMTPRVLYKQAALKAHVDYGGDKIEPVTFDQPLVLVPELVEAWLRKVIPLSKDTSSFERKDVSDFPIEVLREAIINALVHRSFDSEGTKVSLEIDNEKIVIKSPGGPLPSISLKQLNSFNAPSISRNPIIAYVFSLMGYVEETGFGMRSLRSLNEKYGLPFPEYAYKSPFLSLTFPRSIKVVKKVSQMKDVGQLTDAQVKGFEWVKSKEQVSTREYSAHFDIGYKTAQRHLSKMRELRLIGDNGEAINSPRYKFVAL